MGWPFRFKTEHRRRRRNRTAAQQKAELFYQPIIRRLEDRRVLDVTAAFATATGQLDIFVTNGSDTANISIDSGNIVITDSQNQTIDIDVDGGGAGTVNASDVDAIRVAGDAAQDQSVIFQSPLALPRGLAIESSIERAEIQGNMTRVTDGDIQIDAGLTDLRASIETSDRSIEFSGDVRLGSDVNLTGAEVTFRGLVDDDGSDSTTSNLVINASGLTRFDSSVGSNSALTSVSTDAAGRTELNGDVTANGNTIFFADAVTITSDVRIEDLGNTGIIFGSSVNSAVDGHFRLTLSAPNGRVEFNGNLGEGSGGDQRLGGLTVEQAADGLIFGESSGVASIQVAGDIDLGQGTQTIGGDGVLFNGGTSVLQLSTFGGSLRVNGAIRLRTDVNIATAGGDVTFTADATIDSDQNLTQSLAINAGAGAVFFNNDIGAQSALRGLRITRADGGVRFGNADTSTPGGSGPVRIIHSVDDVTIGVGTNAIAGGILFNAGPDNTTQIITSGDHLTLNGPVVLNSHLSIDTGTGPGDIRFLSGPIDSQSGETNDLTLLAGTGRVSFSHNLGVTQPLGAITILQADDGVLFGTADNRLSPTGEGPVAVVRAQGSIDIGTGANEIGGAGIVLNAGTGGQLSIESLGGELRINGVLTLDSDVSVFSNGGDIFFTNDTPVDSRVGETNDLVLDAPNGTISLNEDIGRNVALGSITVLRARDGFILGGATNEFPGTGGLGPVEIVRTTGAIDIGSGMNVVGGVGIVMNGSAIASQQISTDGETVRLNGAVTLGTDVEITTNGGEIFFTHAASIDSAAGRVGGLTLDAGTGRVVFNEDIGATRRIGSLTVTRADAGIVFGGNATETDADGLGPVAAIHTDQSINLGVGTNVIAGGILFNGGFGGTVLSTTSDTVRMNGPVRLQQDLVISTGDGNGNVVFTSAATIDSTDGATGTTLRRFDLTIDVGAAGVFFNANIGSIQPLDQLTIVRAGTGVVFGESDTITGALGPVTLVRTDGAIDIGAGNLPENVIGSVVFNGGAAPLVVQTSSDDVRVNGPTTLRSNVSFVTGPGSGSLTFTGSSPINSQPGELNDLTIDLGDGDAVFEAAIGTQSSLGEILVESVGDAHFADSIVATRLEQQSGSGTTTFDGSINTNHATLAALELTGTSFIFNSAVLATGNGQVTIVHSGLLDINPAADMRIDGEFSESGGGTVDLAGDIATSGDTITFQSPVRLTDGLPTNILLSTVAGGNSTGADIRFPAIDGQTAAAENLLLNAGTEGDILFFGPVGGTVQVGSITIVSAENVTFDQTLTASRFVQLEGSGTTTFSQAVNLNHPSLASLVAQNRNLVFAGPVTTMGEGSVIVSVSDSLEIDPAAIMNLAGAFIQQGAGSVSLGANITTANRDIAFEGPVTLQGKIQLETGAGAGNISFGSTVNSGPTGPSNFVLSAGTGDVEFLGDVGFVLPLGTLTISGGNVTLLGSVRFTSLDITNLNGVTHVVGNLDSIAAGGSIAVRSQSIVLDGQTFANSRNVRMEATEDLTANNSITALDVPVVLIAGRNVVIGAGGSVITRNGRIRIQADPAGVQGGQVVMADGTIVRNEQALIDISADGDITVSRVESQRTISLVSTAGGVVDAGDLAGINIVAPSLMLQTVTGVGTADTLETSISTLAASNSGPGGIHISNRVSGLLTIGDVNGLSGIVDGGEGKVEIINLGAIHVDRAIRNGGGGHTVLRAEIPGDLVVNAPIQNTGGDGFITLYAGGDLILRNSLPEPRDAGGNPIEIPDTENPEQFYELMVTGEGGIRGEARGKVLIDDGEDDYVIVRTATGQITNIPPIVEIEAIDQGGSDLDELGRGFVRVTLGDDHHLETNYHVTIDWGDGEIEHFPIPGTINPLRDQFKGNTDTRFISGDGKPGEYIFLHRYFANPNPDDPSAPIPIRVEVRYDPRAAGDTSVDGNRPTTGSAVFNGIQFFENVAQEIFTTRTEIFTVPGTGGAGFVKVVESRIVPVELRAPAVEPAIRLSVPFTTTSGLSFEFSTANFEAESLAEYRVFMRVVDDVTGQEGEDIPLDISVLDDPVAIFRENRFPNGHYRIYIEEIQTRRTRVILDVHIYNGRVVPPNFRETTGENRVGAGEQLQPAEAQPNQNGAFFTDPSERVSSFTRGIDARSEEFDAHSFREERLDSNIEPASNGKGERVVAAQSVIDAEKRSFTKAARLFRRKMAEDGL